MCINTMKLRCEKIKMDNNGNEVTSASSDTETPAPAVAPAVVTIDNSIPADSSKPRHTSIM